MRPPTARFSSDREPLRFLSSLQRKNPISQPEGYPFATAVYLAYLRKAYPRYTTEFYQQALKTYELSKREETLKEGDMKPRNPDKVFMGPTLIICPVPMISEWQEAIRSNTLLTPILHYGQSFFDRRAWHQINSASKFPWRHVIITTKETLMKRWNTKDYRGQRFWGTEDLPLHRLVLDEAHRFRVSGAPPSGVISPTTGLLSRSDSNSAMAVWAKHLHSLNPEAKWMLTATPLVSTMSDLWWVCRFLQRPEWLSDNLPPDTFANKHDIELGAWFQNPDRPSEDGNNLDATFTPVADPFRDHRAHGSYVHCTIKAWNTFIWGNLNNASKLQHLQRTGTITLNQREHLSDCLRIVGGYVQEILRTLILRCLMVSRIPFRVGKPIIDIPVMKTVTTRLQFADDGSKDVYSFLVNNYAQMRASFGGLTAEGQQAPIPGHKFGPCWRYIRLVSLSPLLAYASFAEEFSTENLFSKDQADQGHPHRLKVKSLLTKFREQMPDKGTDFYPESMANMSDEDMVRAMEFCSPKLGRIKDRLHKLVTLGGVSR